MRCSRCGIQVGCRCALMFIDGGYYCRNCALIIIKNKRPNPNPNPSPNPNTKKQ